MIFIIIQNLLKNIELFVKNEVEKKLLYKDINNSNENDEKELSRIGYILSVISKDTNNDNISALEEFIFDYLTSHNKITLYNIFHSNNLDNKYLNYISTINIQQNIELICIIDRFNYSQFIDNISYAYITSLNFMLFSERNHDDLFMYYNLPINNIFNIFMNYFITIKYYRNIKQISFEDEFVINKNQFISYNDIYYQSFISYLIDQYMISSSDKSDSFLFNINLDNIILKEENLDNIYERFKIIYGFNKMFPNLKNKKLLIFLLLFKLPSIIVLILEL